MEVIYIWTMMVVDLKASLQYMYVFWTDSSLQ